MSDVFGSVPLINSFGTGLVTQQGFSVTQMFAVGTHADHDSVFREGHLPLSPLIVSQPRVPSTLALTAKGQPVHTLCRVHESGGTIEGA